MMPANRCLRGMPPSCHCPVRHGFRLAWPNCRSQRALLIVTSCSNKIDRHIAKTDRQTQSRAERRRTERRCDGAEQTKAEQIAAAMEQSEGGQTTSIEQSKTGTKTGQSIRKPVQRKAEQIAAAMEQRDATQIAAAMEQSKDQSTIIQLHQLVSQSATLSICCKTMQSIQSVCDVRPRPVTRSGYLVTHSTRL